METLSLYFFLHFSLTVKRYDDLFEEFSLSAILLIISNFTFVETLQV